MSKRETEKAAYDSSGIGARLRSWRQLCSKKRATLAWRSLSRRRKLPRLSPEQKRPAGQLRLHRHALLSTASRHDGAAAFKPSHDAVGECKTPASLILNSKRAAASDAHTVVIDSRYLFSSGGRATGLRRA